MKKLLLSSVGIAVLCGGLIGCAKTAEGLAEDTEKNTETASKEVNEALDDVGKAGAPLLTPRLKTAITSDVQLNDSRNRIDVDTTSETVTISGEVYSEEMKIRAEEVVRAEMKQAEANQTLKNVLVVKK